MFEGVVDVSQESVVVGAFAVRVCPSGAAAGAPSCVAGSQFATGAPLLPVSIAMDGISAVSGVAGVAALGQSIAAISFAVVTAIRSYDEGELGRWVVCCEMRAKYVVPGVAAAGGVLGLVGFLAVAAGVPGRVADGEAVWASRSVGAGAVLLLLCSVVMALCVALAVLGGKEVQQLQYERRRAEEAAQQRAGRRTSGSSTAAVLAAAAPAGATPRPRGSSQLAGSKLGTEPLLAGGRPLIGASV